MEKSKMIGLNPHAGKEIKKQVKRGETILLSYDPYSADIDDIGYDWAYDDFIENMTHLKIKGSKYYLQGENMNWKGDEAYAVKDKWHDVIMSLFMHDGQCTIDIYQGDERNTLDAIVYHHDCPTGSRITIMSEHKAIKKGILKYYAI